MQLENSGSFTVIAGVTVVSDAMEEPARQLIVNSRMNPDEVLKKIKRARTKEMVFNSEPGEVQNLTEKGILILLQPYLMRSNLRCLMRESSWKQGLGMRDQLASYPNGCRGIRRLKVSQTRSSPTRLKSRITRATAMWWLQSSIQTRQE